MRQTYALQMLLAIKDAVSPDSSDYNVLLANTNGVPERKKGLNNLKHDVTVTVCVICSVQQTSRGARGSKWTPSAIFGCPVVF